jgi:hypothetical protein
MPPLSPFSSWLTACMQTRTLPQRAVDCTFAFFNLRVVVKLSEKIQSLMMMMMFETGGEDDDRSSLDPGGGGGPRKTTVRSLTRLAF